MLFIPLGAPGRKVRGRHRPQDRHGYGDAQRQGGFEERLLCAAQDPPQQGAYSLHFYFSLLYLFA